MKLRLAALAILLLCGQANAQSPGTAVQGVIINRATINGSVTITTGNTFQTVLSSNLGATTSQGGPLQRQALTIENNNASDNCWLFIGPTASATKGTSILLLPGGSYSRYWPYVPSDNIAATCATTSDTLYIDNN